MAGKKIYKKQKSFTILRYAILAIAAIFLVAGLITPLLFLDPYSNYGRIIANIFRPLYLLLNNFGALSLESMEVYTLYRVEPGVTNWFSISFSILFFFMLVWLSLKYARLFCNTLCPVGSFLGLLSRFSIFRISLDKSLCTSCGKCASACKAGCIDYKERTVDFSRCIGCLNCLNSCPTNGVQFNRKYNQKAETLKPFNPERRSILAGVLEFPGSVMSRETLLENRPRGR